MDKIPLDDLKQRTLIVGNSGAGKSTLAEKLAQIVNVPAIDLDQLHWEEGGYRRKRNEELAKRLVRDVAAKPHWIVEGVFGWLAEVALPRATCFIRHTVRTIYLQIGDEGKSARGVAFVPSIRTRRANAGEFSALPSKFSLFRIRAVDFGFLANGTKGQAASRHREAASGLLFTHRASDESRSVRRLDRDANEFFQDHIHESLTTTTFPDIPARSAFL